VWGFNDGSRSWAGILAESASSTWLAAAALITAVGSIALGWAKNRYESRGDTITQQHDILKDSIVELRTQIAEGKAREQDLEDEVVKLRGDVRSLRKEVGELRAAGHRAQEDNERLQARNGRLIRRLIELGEQEGGTA
jgi:chromosome segregation ATPase